MTSTTTTRTRALYISGHLPTFHLLPFGPKEEGRVAREEVVGVKGVFLLHNVLSLERVPDASRAECEECEISDSESISTGLKTAIMLKDVTLHEGSPHFSEGKFKYADIHYVSQETYTMKFTEQEEDKKER
jgi:hypothetical protein